MAEKSRLTRSPRDLRDSTNDPGKFSKGELQLEQNEPRKSGGPENEDAWSQSGYNERDASGWPKGI
jgi:hypothetical protein